ncbi:MAG: HAMP domain-containing histidine kinase [Candidatus Gastranaerophilales bacterium]|nr:HAMP domain-containing histidine kinase [Candidatus Gastranaerophilales bacterium]
MSITEASLKLINDIINNTSVQNLNYYESVLEMVSLLYGDKFSLSIFFCENTDYVLKCAIKNNSFVSGYNFKNKIQEFLFDSKKTIEMETKEDEVFYKKTFITKLTIKESVFGFMCLSTNLKIDTEIKNSFESLSNVISYKIKDYELNEVFKMQLKAMQDAIIEKESAYDVIKKQHKKLQELDKTKNLFLANISHELRTPLNAIIGFSQALDSQIFGELNEKQAEYIKDIQISSLHLLGMINEILDISKLEANAMKFNPAQMNPAQAINEVVNILEPLYKNKNIEVIFNSGMDFNIKADYQKFQQILYNLLSNAIKFTGKDGKIEIIQEIQNTDYILKIKDDGVGIDKKHHNKIFKKFVHIDNIYSKSQTSTGLGLPITKELVRLHNGKITLESEIGKGTTFIMEFKKIVL